MKPKLAYLSYSLSSSLLSPEKRRDRMTTQKGPEDPNDRKKKVLDPDEEEYKGACYSKLQAREGETRVSAVCPSVMLS